MLLQEPNSLRLWMLCAYFQRLCLNGSSGQEVIIGTGLETVEALAFEPISQLLYWVNAGIPKIEVHLSAHLEHFLVTFIVRVEP